jgi:hypothetical protein
MSEIKDDAVTLRNRTLIQKILAHQIEERIALPASVGQAFHELMRDCDAFFCSKHSALPI